jgi:hypothetical protein
MARFLQGMSCWQLLTEQQWANKTEELKRVLPELTPESVSCIMRNYGYTSDWKKNGTPFEPSRRLRGDDCE